MLEKNLENKIGELGRQILFLFSVLPITMTQKEDKGADVKLISVYNMKKQSYIISFWDYGWKVWISLVA
ncbi:MAG: hypothetical protein LBN19_04575 [Endomicrobium sp.]|jgi:hypothetical protein|nr:hypothetical protein [Endomicrobium sp.]